MGADFARHVRIPAASAEKLAQVSPRRYGSRPLHRPRCTMDEIRATAIYLQLRRTIRSNTTPSLLARHAGWHRLIALRRRSVGKPWGIAERRARAACHAPWHPEDVRCAVPRAGPENWARWALWGRASTSAGRAAGTQRALRLAHTHTIVCERCGDLVPLQKARTAARGARRSSISPADGCYGCGRHYRKSRRAERQGGMALAILAGTRVLLETPPSAAARVELWMLPRFGAEGHARRVLARYQPRGLGRWLTHACCHRA